MGFDSLPMASPCFSLLFVVRCSFHCFAVIRIALHCIVFFFIPYLQCFVLLCLLCIVMLCIGLNYRSLKVLYCLSFVAFYIALASYAAFCVAALSIYCQSVPPAGRFERRRPLVLLLLPLAEGSRAAMRPG